MINISGAPLILRLLTLVGSSLWVTILGGPGNWGGHGRGLLGLPCDVLLDYYRRL